MIFIGYQQVNLLTCEKSLFKSHNDMKNHGIGIKNVATRVEYLNGNVNFDSAIGRGTSVIVEIPLINTK